MTRRAAGRHEALSDEELDFVGMRPNGHKPTGGWRQAAARARRDDGGFSAEDSNTLAALMGIPSREQLQFQ